MNVVFLLSEWISCGYCKTERIQQKSKIQTTINFFS